MKIHIGGIELTGEAFEGLMCAIFNDEGYWALRIPRNHSGAQPFDVLAIKGDEIFAVDCKVCSQPRFQLSRVEDNQWLSMTAMSDRTYACLGFMCYCDGEVYFVCFREILEAQERGQASIRLTEENRWLARDEFLEV